MFMVAASATTPDLDTLQPDALKAIIVAQQLQLLSNGNEIEHLKLLVAKLRRMQFGRGSEKVTRQIEQLELQLKIWKPAKLKIPRKLKSNPLPRPHLHPQKHRTEGGVRCRIICHARFRLIFPPRSPARIAAAC
jgi:hypothetical protein